MNIRLDLLIALLLIQAALLQNFPIFSMMIYNSCTLAFLEYHTLFSMDIIPDPQDETFLGDVEMKEQKSSIMNLQKKEEQSSPFNYFKIHRQTKAQFLSKSSKNRSFINRMKLEEQMQQLTALKLILRESE